MELDPVERSLVSDFRKRLESLVGDNLRDLRVFGSRARGDARLGSDLDVFVLLGHCDRRVRHRILDIAEDLNEEHAYVMDLSPLVMDEAEFNLMRDRERRLALDILREGIAV